jgi:hypothetical protein
MTTHFTRNQSIRRFAFMGAALLVGAGNAMAASYGDAQEQARALLDGAHRDGVQAPLQSLASGGDNVVDAQVRAQWLFAGRPGGPTSQPGARESLSATSSPASGAIGVNASEMARRMLAGKGT